MYAYISGKLAYKDPAIAIIDCAGVGYEIRISLPTYSAIEVGAFCKLHTFLHIKEDAHTIFGFADVEDKRLFLLLIGISGVGPTTALTLLSSMSAGELKEAIARAEVLTIQKVKGIGIKTAQRIVLELQDKIKKEGYSDLVRLAQGVSAPSHIQQEALSALTVLGIAKAVAEKSIQAVVKKHGDALTVEDLIKYALKTN